MRTPHSSKSIVFSCLLNVGVLLGLHQVISDIKSTWEADKKTYKFGVNYFESADDPLLNTKNSTLLRVARKDPSVMIPLNKKKELFGAPKREKKAV